MSSLLSKIEQIVSYNDERMVNVTENVTHYLNELETLLFVRGNPSLEQHTISSELGVE